MNVEKIEELAQTIELEDNIVFDMSAGIDYARYDCGTAACIAGHAVLMAHQEGKLPADFAQFLNECQEIRETSKNLAEESLQVSWSSVEMFAQNYLELTVDEADELFLKFGDISKKAAVLTLRKFAETGEIDWEGCIKETENV